MPCMRRTRRNASWRVSSRSVTLHESEFHDATPKFRDSDNTCYRALSSVAATINVGGPAAGGDVEMAETAQEAGGLPADTHKQIDETHATLSAARKKRKAP